MLALLALATCATFARADDSKPIAGVIVGHWTRPPLPLPIPPILYEPCPEFEHDPLATACYDPNSGIVYAGVNREASTRAHELGHVVDARYLTEGERNRFLRLAGVPSIPWTDEALAAKGRETSILRTGDELFAETYAHCRVDAYLMRRLTWFTTFSDAKNLGGRQRRVMCAFIARAMQ